MLMATAFVDMLGFALVFPLLPFYATRLGASPALLGLMISSFSVAQLATAPLWGRVSDRYGRRPVLMVGLGAAGLAYIVFGLANSVWLLLLSRLVQGAGGGTTGVVQAYIGDSTDPTDRARGLGWLSAATSAGVMVGPAIGSLAVNLGPAAPGFVAAGLCLLNVLFAWRFLPESNRNQGRPRRAIRAAVWHVIRHPFAPHPRLIWIYAVGMGAFTSMTAVLALYFADRFGITEKTIGAVFVYTGFLSVVMRAVVLGWLVDRLGEARVMRIGAVLLVAGLVLYTVPSNLWVMALVVPLVPMGTALLFPSVTALSSHQSDQRELGQMMGVQQAFGGIARVIAPVVSTSIYQAFSPRDPFLFAAGLMLLVTVLAFRIPLRARQATEAAA